MIATFPLLGLLAGVLTTLTGQGGGLLLLLATSAVVGPKHALAITAPALLCGNLHRTALLWRSIDRSIAARVIAGAVPGAVLGGLATGVMPSWAIRVLMVALTALAIAKALGWLRFRVAPAALAPSGFALGAMTGTSGGAGVLVSPILLSAGLNGRAFVGTSAVIAASMHVGRVVGYAGLGMFSRELLGYTALVTLAIFVGNAVGTRALELVRPRAQRFLEYGTLVVCVALSVAG